MISLLELAEVKEKENTMILFSGGLDSTYMLIEEAKRLDKKYKNTKTEKEPEEDPVYVIDPSGSDEKEEPSILSKDTVNFIENDKPIIDLVYADSTVILENKRVKELESIKLIIEKIMENYNVVCNLIVVKTDIQFERAVSGNGKGSSYAYLAGQTPIWISTLLHVLPQCNNKNINILIGLLLSDENTYYEACKYKTTIDNIFSSYWKDGSNIDVCFPLSTTPKWKVILDMIKNYPDFYDLTHTCEAPKDGIACGLCNSCNTRYNTFNNIKSFFSTDSEYLESKKKFIEKEEKLWKEGYKETSNKKRKLKRRFI